MLISKWMNLKFYWLLQVGVRLGSCGIGFTDLLLMLQVELLSDFGFALWVDDWLDRWMLSLLMIWFNAILFYSHCLYSFPHWFYCNTLECAWEIMFKLGFSHGSFLMQAWNMFDFEVCISLWWRCITATHLALQCMLCWILFPVQHLVGC